MSATKSTDVSALVQEIREAKLKEYAEQHGTNVARAAEAFGRTVALVRGLQNVMVSNNVAQSAGEQVLSMVGGYADQTLAYLCMALSLSQEQVDKAGELGEKLFEEIAQAYFNAAEDKPENNHASVGTAGIKLVH